MGHPLPTTIIALTTAIAAFLAIMAYSAWKRSDKRTLLFVMGAFALFTVKGIVTIYGLQAESSMLGHETLEMISSIFDLAIVGLLVAPFLKRK